MIYSRTRLWPWGGAPRQLPRARLNHYGRSCRTCVSLSIIIHRRTRRRPSHRLPRPRRGRLADLPRMLERMLDAPHAHLAHTTHSWAHHHGRGTCLHESRALRTPLSHDHVAAHMYHVGMASLSWICLVLWRAQSRLTSAILVSVILAGSSLYRTQSPHMDSVNVGEAGAEFDAAAVFDGARQGYVFRSGDQGVGYYRDEQSSKRRRLDMPPPSPRPPLPRSMSQPPPPPPPPQPPPPSIPQLRLPPLATTKPATLTATTHMFWDELDAFGRELDASSAASARLLRPPSPPAHLPLPGTMEIIQWRPRRRRQHQQRTAPHKWPTAPRANLVAQQAQAQPQVRGQSQAQGEVQVPLPDVNAMLMEWTEGTRPGSAEWVQALRDRGAPQPQWWSTGLHFDNIG